MSRYEVGTIIQMHHIVPKKQGKGQVSIQMDYFKFFLGILFNIPDVLVPISVTATSMVACTFYVHKFICLSVTSLLIRLFNYYCNILE